VPLALMRRMVGDAGHLERLYWAVKISHDTSVDSERLQWRQYIKQYGDQTKNLQQRKGGLTMGKKGQGRSVEPHLAFAKEMGLLEMPSKRVGGRWPSMGRWLITAHAGRPFLALWEYEKQQPPKNMLLALMLKHDKSFLIPFVSQILDEGNRAGPVIAAKIWEYLWKRYKREMILAEPPFPRSLWWKDGRLKRTAKHHSNARLRFMVKPEGLNLKEDALKRLVESFVTFEEKELPPDYYSKISYTLNGTYPTELEEKEVLNYASYAHENLCQTSYVSALGAFNYINEIILPDSTINWDYFLKVLRTNEAFSLHSSLMRGDILFKLRKLREVV
jgi:hypothetical protein